MSEAAQASTNSKWTPGCGKRHLPPTTSRLSTGFRQQMCAAHRKIILITDVAERRQNGFPPTNCSEKNSCCKASQAQPQPVALVTKSNWQAVTITVQTWTISPTKSESIRQLKQKGLFSCGKKDASTTHLRRLRAGNCFINSHFYFWLKQSQDSETETKRTCRLSGRPAQEYSGHTPNTQKLYKTAAFCTGIGIRICYSKVHLSMQSP